MDDAAALIAAIHSLVFAPQHVTIKLRKDDYANAFTSLLKTFEKVFGSALKPSDVEAWKKFVAIALTLIETECKKL